MIEKWYRGHSGKQQATDNFGIIWLADNYEYAQRYADEYEDGVVSTVFVDMDKVHEFDWRYDDNFDQYAPSMRQVKEYMEETGGNAYTFGLYDDDTTVLALLTIEPIVKIEKTIIENKKYRNMKIKLTENKLKQIVAESVKKVLKEEYDQSFEENFEDEKGTGQVLISIASNGADIEFEGDEVWCEEIIHKLNLHNYHSNIYVNDRLVN